MRLLGIFLLSLTPFLLGLEYRIGLKKRRDFLRLFKEFIIFVKEQIRFCGREREEIFTLALNDPRFNTSFIKRLDIALKNGENITKIFDDNIDIRLKPKEIYEINAFITDLGKSDTEGQIAHCDYYISVFEQGEKKFSEAYSAKSKLSLGLSLSLEAAMFIIMI